MGQTLCLLTAAWLAAQTPDTTDGSPLPAACVTAQTPAPIGGSPPHQPLWTCSSTLHWHNRMTCHYVEDVSLPFLDCCARICDCLTHKRKSPIRFLGISTAPITGGGQHVPVEGMMSVDGTECVPANQVFEELPAPNSSQPVVR